MKSIFDYTDYRRYIADFYELQKTGNYFYSYRFMAGKLGIDHSILIKVINGTRHLNDQHIRPLCQLCKLNGREAQFLDALIRFNKARTDQQGKVFFEQMLSLKSYVSQTLESDQFEYFQKWHHSAIRSLLDYFDFNGDYDSLGTALSPAISGALAKKSIELLVRLKLIEKKKDGRYLPTAAHITTGATWKSMAIDAYQRETIELSAGSIERHPREARDISSITMSVDKDCFDDVVRLAKEFRATVIKRVNEIPDNRTDRVYQLNIQYIPVSVLPSEADGKREAE